MNEHNDDILTELRRIADALEHLSGTGTSPVLEKIILLMSGILIRITYSLS